MWASVGSGAVSWQAVVDVKFTLQRVSAIDAMQVTFKFVRSAEQGRTQKQREWRSAQKAVVEDNGKRCSTGVRKCAVSCPRATITIVYRAPRLCVPSRGCASHTTGNYWQVAAVANLKKELCKPVIDEPATRVRPGLHPATKHTLQYYWNACNDTRAACTRQSLTPPTPVHRPAKLRTCFASALTSTDSTPFGPRLSQRYRCRLMPSMLIRVDAPAWVFALRHSPAAVQRLLRTACHLHGPMTMQKPGRCRVGWLLGVLTVFQTTT